MIKSVKMTESGTAPAETAHWNLLQRIARKQSNKEKLAAKVIAAPELLPLILEGLKSDRPAVKYGCDRVLMALSERAPAILYPRMAVFIELLASENHFLKWGAIRIVANLAGVDTEGKFEANFDKFFAPLQGPVMITAANIAGSAARIALAKPHLTERIVLELLKVERACYQTAECRNVALGHVIVALGEFFDRVKNKESVVAMIKRQLDNSRNATRTKAAKFVKRFGL